MESFAVIWSDSTGPIVAGKLVLEAAALRFEGPGGRNGSPFVHRVYYEDIESVYVGRDNGDRLAGRQSLVLELAVGGRLRIGSVNGVGVLTELASRLGHLTATNLAV
jgi:hypothetical protein